MSIEEFFEGVELPESTYNEDLDPEQDWEVDKEAEAQRVIDLIGQ